ncbi:nucleotide exchange factor GrpE [Moraxella sp. ZY200743]|uniref:nucleotide exchange factor GrpE n=1 Tax=Moraxella sp. ZY200743 TaxID=2911970 RepID=UPI003D7D4F4E
MNKKNLTQSEDAMNEQEQTQDPILNDNQEKPESNETDELAKLTATIETLENEVKEAKEAAARANAESYNAQRRMEQETDKAKKFALQKFAKELLDVVDNLERGLEASEKSGADESVLEGLKLTHKSLLSVLEKNGVVAVGEVGKTFNPDLHEAVGIFPDADKDTIGQVLQKGYTLNERTLRPAMVLVGA